MAEHTDEAKDAFVESLLFSSAQDTPMTISTKQKPKVRERTRTSFTIHTVPVCRDCYLFSIGYVKIYLLANDVICLLSTLTLHIAKLTKLPHSNR